MPTSFLRSFLLVGSACAALACGPIGATSVIGDAEIAVARAHTEGGDKYAIYETTSADLLLQKAREEQGYAHYSAASDLARKSVLLAETATKKSAEAKKNPDAAPAPPPGLMSGEVPPRVVKPGDPVPQDPQPPPRAPQPKPEPIKAEPAAPETKPDGGTEGEQPRRVIKPGDAQPDAPARERKVPIEIVEPGDKR